MRILGRFFACAVVLASAQIFASAQQLDLTQPGAQYGYTATDLDADTGGGLGNRVYRIRLTDGVTVRLGLTNVNQELEGFFSIDNFAGGNRSHLFAVAENPDATSSGDPSNLVDLTAAAVSDTGLGTQIGNTGITFGTEAGSAYDFINGVAYSVATDDRIIVIGGQQYPATALYIIDPSTGQALGPLSIDDGIAIDGLAFGADGVLYGSDARVTDSLYRYNFDEGSFEAVGLLGPATTWSEDSGLAVYRGANGDETNLYLLTEGDGATRVGRIWTLSPATGTASFVAEVRFADGTEVPEDLEGFDIPYLPPDGL
ncbi:MAG TPA: hypothetical protein VJ302_35405 [Blastocatellia bacterium]|nr:hypothetical protein [Blastocatellia bacterium]